MAKEYDLVVVGGGIGGYSGAIKAAKEGLSVALVESDLIGGTCLNRGCIPTKAYLKSAEMVRKFQDMSEFGIVADDKYKIDFTRIIDRKDKIVQTLRNGVSALLKMNKIDYFNGEGSVLGTSIFTPKSGSVMIKPNDGSDEIVLTPKNVLIATGSRPTSLPTVQVDEKNILTSNGILQMTELPESITIIGGGVIGVEWASLLNDLGVKVTIVEFQDRLIINENPKVSNQLKNEFEKRGIEVNLSTKVQSAAIDNGQTTVTAQKGDKGISFEAEKILVAVGRKPNVENIGLEAAGVEFTRKGIKVDEFYQTTAENIYAVGDVIPTVQLAHVAAKESELVVDKILEREVIPLDYDNIARGIYTFPEIASVGLVDGKASDGANAKKGQFDFKFNGKSMIQGELVGQVEMFTDIKTDDVIGLSIVGPHATDMISEGALGIYLNASPEEFGDTVHPHPTLSEAIMEAANDTFGMSVNK
ncbi:dihydrolipoyl dehydrogenase [Companilactobacillus hulinensis]|uniref:dihydrolipoyl dehydrogenase n=1 Tax=Companilactobacillus hulinensis TaxID=2486007 RepID=UPI000F7928A5|nr:dihydrolipoyl dehydrogenase [Companilactobacillus hulinensis]